MWGAIAPVCFPPAICRLGLNPLALRPLGRCHRQTGPQGTPAGSEVVSLSASGGGGDDSSWGWRLLASPWGKQWHPGEAVSSPVGQVPACILLQSFSFPPITFAQCLLEGKGTSP